MSILHFTRLRSSYSPIQQSCRDYPLVVHCQHILSIRRVKAIELYSSQNKMLRLFGDLNYSADIALDLFKLRQPFVLQPYPNISKSREHGIIMALPSLSTAGNVTSYMLSEMPSC
jgi:hypothetical protein